MRRKWDCNRHGLLRLPLVIIVNGEMGKCWNKVMLSVGPATWRRENVTKPWTWFISSLFIVFV